MWRTIGLTAAGWLIVVLFLFVVGLFLFWIGPTAAGTLVVFLLLFGRRNERAVERDWETLLTPPPARRRRRPPLLH